MTTQDLSTLNVPRCATSGKTKNFFKVPSTQKEIYFMDTCGPHRNQSLQQGTDAKRHPHAEGSIIATAPGKPEKLQWMVSVFGIKVSGSLFNEMNKQNKISRKYRD